MQCSFSFELALREELADTSKPERGFTDEVNTSLRRVRSETARARAEYVGAKRQYRTQSAILF